MDTLTGFLRHVTYTIWIGQERRLFGLNGAKRLKTWDITSQETVRYVRGSFLGHLQDRMFLDLNMPLISTFVERWHPEMNSFHMPLRELKITLHDVWQTLVVRRPLRSVTIDLT